MYIWDELEHLAPISLTHEQYAAIEIAYSEPPRAYHSFVHVLSVAKHWQDVDRRLGWNYRKETFLAVLYHDAIYIPGRNDNELKSASFAREQLIGIEDVDIIFTEGLILPTAEHGKLAADKVDWDTSHFLDCDMAILGAARANFSTYEKGIRSEYAYIPATLYRVGRRRFIERLLASPRIFLSDDFLARFEESARNNLRWALTTLE